MSATATEVVIADPLIGKLVIPRSELERRYRFTGFFLIIHPPAEQRNLEADWKIGF
jgi:hypothetical protein